MSDYEQTPCWRHRPGDGPASHRGLPGQPGRRGRRHRRSERGAPGRDRRQVRHRHALRLRRRDAGTREARHRQHRHAEQVSPAPDPGGVRGGRARAVREADGDERRGRPPDARGGAASRQAADDQLLLPLHRAEHGAEVAGGGRHPRRCLLRPHDLASPARPAGLRRLVRPEGALRRRPADRPGRAPPRSGALADGLPQAGLGHGQRLQPHRFGAGAGKGRAVRRGRPGGRDDQVRERRHAWSWKHRGLPTSASAS